jgi:hypothetical protein
MKLGATSLKGATGKRYEFAVYAWDTKLKPGHGGVYMVTRRHATSKGGHEHHIIYMDAADDLHAEIPEHPLRSQFEAEQANCLCVHASQSESARNQILEDLSQAHTPGIARMTGQRP